MIELERPLALALLLPWAFFRFWFYQRQVAAVAWIRDNVAERFRTRLSMHTKRSLRWHGALIEGMGLLLVLAAAQPSLVGEGEVAGGGRVLLLLDASATHVRHRHRRPAPRVDGR